MNSWNQPNDAEPSVGTLHLFPRDTTNRNLWLAQTPAATNWSAAVTATLIPEGAKAILCSAYLYLLCGSTSRCYCRLHFSDNNTATPTTNTSQPILEIDITLVTGYYANNSSPLIIPINSNKQFYIYSSAQGGTLSAGYPSLSITLDGYYI
jgi:hypothetical protein